MSIQHAFIYIPISNTSNIIVMISIFIKILVYDSEIGKDFVNRFFGGELNKVVYYY